MKIKVSPKTTVKISDPLEMVGFLRTNGTKAQFISILTVTEPKLTADCPYKGVVKVSRRNGLINVDYNLAVRRRLAKTLGVSIPDVEYANGKTPYQHELDGNGKALPLLVKKSNPKDGVFYLQYFPMHSKQTRYVLPNGEEISEKILSQYFYARSESASFKPPVIAPKIVNIKELRASGVIIQTDETDEAVANLSAE